MPGHGNIRKLASGRYQVRFTDQFGTRRSAGSFSSRKAANEALRAALVAVESEMYEPERVSQLKVGRTLTLEQVARRYRDLGTRGGRSLSPRTLSEYASYISRDLSHLAKKPIASITRSEIEDWWLMIGDRGTLSLRAKVYSHLKSLCGFALRQGWIAVDPCQIRGGSQSPLRRSAIIPSVAQVKTLIESAPEEFKALFAIAAWGGLRKGELLELRRKDVLCINNKTTQLALVQVQRAVIWLPNGLIQVRTPKWDSARDVLLPPQATELIFAQMGRIGSDPETLLFPAHPSRALDHVGNHKLNRIWYKVRASAGYSGTFHSLRSFAGTQFAVAGATLRETMSRLGHSSTKTALRYQVDVGREDELVLRMSSYVGSEVLKPTSQSQPLS